MTTLDSGTASNFQATRRESEGSAGSNLTTMKRKSFGLTFSRGWLVQIAEQTVKIGQEGVYVTRSGKEVRVAEALRYSMKNSKHYHSSHTFHPTETTSMKFDCTEFHVCYGSSLQVADKLRIQLETLGEEHEIGILNSASGKRPEKFLRGTLSQEEGICRATLLYPCLMQYYGKPHHFYFINNKPKYQESSSSCAIYSPKVPVIREDSVEGYLLDEIQTYSMVSIPAANAFFFRNEEDDRVIPKAQKPGSSDRDEPYENMTVESAMYDRCFRALSIFAEQGCTDLVLCAFGCGVHGNSPRMIARCFKEILTEKLAGRFRTVAFAINPSRPQNYEEFFEELEDVAVC